MSISFSPQQVTALDEVAKWLKSGSDDQQVFRLFGYAGTGKTTLARHLAEGLDGPVCYAAFTGKAALMMHRSGCVDASTIHRLIYRPVGHGDGTTTFELNRQSDAATADLIVIDECSMVDKKLGKDLMSFGKPILVLGDPAQLPPVEGAGFFTDAKPDILLTEVHRQAWDSAVLRLATDVREGRDLERGTYDNCLVVTPDDIDEADLAQHDQILVGRNSTRDMLNRDMRARLGFEPGKPCLGDRLICTRNDYGLEIFNGGVFRVITEPKLSRYLNKYGMKVVPEDEPDQEPFRITVRPEFFTGDLKKLSKRELVKTHHFEFCYAMTAHKSQGSQWNNVVVFDESWVFKKEARRWLYTAVTRARDSVTIVTGR